MTQGLRAPIEGREVQGSCALVIDDHPMIHLGCRQMLRDAGFDEVLAAASAEDGIALARQQQPTLAVLDVELPGAGGLESLAPLREAAPEMRILVFSMSDQPAFAARALDAGAHGFLSKNADPGRFRGALSEIRAGGIYLDHDTAMKLVTRRGLAAQGPLTGLTPREREVLFLLGDGMALAQIAGDLQVSYKTAANTCAALKKKLGTPGLNGLIRIALENADARL